MSASTCSSFQLHFLLAETVETAPFLILLFFAGGCRELTCSITSWSLLWSTIIWVLTRRSIIQAIGQLLTSRGTLFLICCNRSISLEHNQSRISVEVGFIIIVALCFLCLPLRNRLPCLFCLSLVLGSS